MNKLKEILCYTYMAQTDNPFWGGDAPLDQIAEQIARAHGPSGSNRDYLFYLAEAIRKIAPINDEHLNTLDRLVKDILSDDIKTMHGLTLTTKRPIEE